MISPYFHISTQCHEFRKVQEICLRITFNFANSGARDAKIICNWTFNYDINPSHCKPELAEVNGERRKRHIVCTFDPWFKNTLLSELGMFGSIFGKPELKKIRNQPRSLWCGRSHHEPKPNLPTKTDNHLFHFDIFVNLREISESSRSHILRKCWRLRSGFRSMGLGGKTP